MQSMRVGLNFNEYLLIFCILLETFLCSSLVTEPTDCRHPNDIYDHRKDYPVIKKRIKRFLYPQILLLNVNSNSCGCNRRRFPVGFPYGLGSTFSPINGGLGGGLGRVNRRAIVRKSRLSVDRRRLMRAQPFRSQRRRALNLNKSNINRNNNNRNDGKRKASRENKRNGG